MNLNEAVDMLNEAVTLSPSLWSLFDVQVPCAPVVGQITNIELMDTGVRHMAFANTLGLLNGIVSNPNERIGITVENSGGRATRKFAVFRIPTDASTSSPDVILSEVPDQESGT